MTGADPQPLDAERARAFLHQAARRVSDRVHRQIREDRRKLGEKTGIGADGTATRYIDQIAEDVLLEVLEESDLPLDVLSEEAGHIDRGGTHTLVMDPIDGTRNATHHIPFYCVSLAIGKSSISDVEYALVRNIPTGEFYWARKGHGATLNGEPIHVRESDPEELMVAAIFEEPTVERGFWGRPEHHVRDMGSSALEMALVASGSFDAFVCPFAFLRVIDIAASVLILREAGGEVFGADARPLDAPFDLKARSAVFALADPARLEAFL